MIFTPVIKAIEKILFGVFFENKDSAHELQEYFKNHRELGSKDRKQMAALVYFVVRWWLKLQYAVGNKDEIFSPESIPVVMSLAVKLLDFKLKKEVDLPECDNEWVNIFSDENIPSNVRVSVPIWIYSQVLGDYPKEAIEILESLNKEARVSLRLNGIKTNSKTLETLFNKAGISFKRSELTPDGYVVERLANLKQSDIFKNGLIEFQDEASQQLMVLAKPESGMWLLDVCAGKGGKSLHAASLMQNKGIIVASDINMSRMKELQRRVERAGVEIVQYEEPKWLYKYRDSMDMVVIDVPCSGLGTLMRKPDVKWKLTPEDIEKYIKVQKELLDNHAELVKKGGKVAYATCSILKREGENQIAQFLASHSQFSLIQEMRYHPHIHGTDGFYVAVLERKS